MSACSSGISSLLVLLAHRCASELDIGNGGGGVVAWRASVGKTASRQTCSMCLGGGCFLIPFRLFGWPQRLVIWRSLGSPQSARISGFSGAEVLHLAKIQGSARGILRFGFMSSGSFGRQVRA